MRQAALLFASALVLTLGCGGSGVGSVEGSSGSDGGALPSADGGAAAGGADAGASDAGPVLAAECRAIAPGALTAAVRASVPHRSGEQCASAVTDDRGNLSAESHPGSGELWRGHWQVYAADGAPRGSYASEGADDWGQGEGFQSTWRDDDGADDHGADDHGGGEDGGMDDHGVDDHGAHELWQVQWSPAGQQLRRTRLDDGRCSGEAFEAANGGTLVLDDCGGQVSGTRFDATGNAQRAQQLERAPNAAAVIDLQDRALIVYWPGSAVGVQSAYAARWYDGALSPLTGFFALPAAGSSRPVLRVLADGGAAVQIDGRWVAVVQSGRGSADAPPAWLSSRDHTDFRLVRAKHAYAVTRREGAEHREVLELVAPSGALCGAVTFPADGLTVGRDGTVIGSSGEGGCDKSWWSGLLR